MTASLATAGQNGWNCSVTGGYRYCPDAALRYCGKGYQNGCRPGDYETLHEFMRYARALQPIFLIVDQFNEFVRPDERWDSNTNDDAEPTREWGYSGLQALGREIRAYRASSRSLAQRHGERNDATVPVGVDAAYAEEPIVFGER